MTHPSVGSSRAEIVQAIGALTAGPTDAGVALALRAEAARELAQTAALREALTRLDEAGIPALLMKGAALSYTCYQGRLRPRNDDDLLVRPGDFQHAGVVLRGCGYQGATQVTDETITGQRLYSRSVFGITHHLDLHARPLNPVAFDQLPSFGELADLSVALPAIAPCARALGPVHALLLACAHRVAHHTPTEDPVWLLDIHLLATALDQRDWNAFVDAAMTTRTARLAWSELMRATATHGTHVPSRVLTHLCGIDGEPSARHLRPRGTMHAQWLNLVHERSWVRRLALIRGHLIPPAEYMRQHYGSHAARSLPQLYVRRLAVGGARWLREWWNRR